MWKAGLVGFVALATIGSSSAVFAETEAGFEQNRSVTRSGTVVSHAQIARLKADLKLTAEQEPLWPAVERAFRELSAQQLTDGSQGLVQGIRSRAVSVGLNAVALRRLAAAAYPLIRTLTEEQKQSALFFARSVGLESVAAAF